jgi:hypothetical protein
MTEENISISQLPPLPLPVQGTDLLHVARGGTDYRLSRTELVKVWLTQLQDMAVSSPANGHTLLYNSTTQKWGNGFISWSQVADKPSQFDPTAHLHTWGEITDPPETYPPTVHIHEWGDLTGVPSVFPPETHAHPWSDLTGIPSSFTPSVHTHLWADLTDKPTEFPPEAHDHASLYYDKAELNTSGAGGQVHWDNVTDKPPLGEGSGDMSTSVYDADEDGVVTAAASAPWAGITGKPATFPADPHNHDDRYFTETELGTSGQSSVHWDNVTDKPAIDNVWGDITGTLANQADLQGALDGKAAAGHAHTAAEMATTIHGATSYYGWLAAEDEFAFWHEDTGELRKLNWASLSLILDNLFASSFLYRSVLTALGDTIYASSYYNAATLAGNTTTTRKFMRQVGTGSASAAPAWDTLQAADIPDLSSAYADVGHEHSGLYADATGWIPVVQTWTYGSADAPVYTIYASGDVTAIPEYKAGNKIRCVNNSTTVYGFILVVGAYDSGNDRTPVYIYTGNNYTIANSAITVPFVGKIKSPDGFPMGRSAWDVESVTQGPHTIASPTVNIWYGGSGLTATGPSLTVPIGPWYLSYQTLMEAAVTLAAAGSVGGRMTLSNSPTTELTRELTVSAVYTMAAAGNATQRVPVYRRIPIEVINKTTYYINIMVASGAYSSLTINPSNLSRSIITAEFGYL